MRSYVLDLVWPTAGVNRSVAYQRQPPYTTPDALNCRTDDMAEYRERGGSRPGLGLALRTQLPGPIRMLTSVAVLRATWERNYAPLYGAAMDDRLPPVSWDSAPTFVPSQTSYQGLGASLQAAGGSFGATWPVGMFAGRNNNGIYELSWFLRPRGDELLGQAKILLLLADVETDVFVDCVEAVLDFTELGWSGGLKEYVGGSVTQTVNSALSTVDMNQPGTMTVSVNAPGAGLNEIKLYWRRHLVATMIASEINGHESAFQLLSGDIEVTKVKTDYEWATGIVKPYRDLRRNVLVAISEGNIYLEDTADSLRISVSDAVNPDADLTSADREQKLYIADYGAAVSGLTATIAGPGYDTLTDAGFNFTALGIDTNYVVQMVNSDYSQNEKQSVALFNTDGGSFRLGFRGSFTAPIPQSSAGAAVKSALELLPTIDTVNVTGSAGGPFEVEFTGTLAGQDLELLAYQADSLTNTGPGVPAIEITSVQPGAGGDFVAGSYQISSVAGSNITFTPAIAVASGFSATIGAVEYSVVRAPKIYDPAAGSVILHSASTGNVPAGCRLVCLYHDRIVYAGADLSPHVWYMSRKGDPHDWDYSQEDSAAAIFAQPSVAGALADPITALIAHGDECLIIGCYNSLWIVRGDPGYGGTVDQLSRKVGIVGSHAWCRTPDDMCVFLSPDGLYVMPAGCHGFPTSLSREALPDDLIGLAPERDRVVMEYDTLHRGIHIFVTRYDEGKSNHWWFDWEAKSFWRVKLQTDHEPLAIYERVAWDDVPVVLIAGRDGYIRHFDRDYQQDDQDSPIESYCCLGPFMLSKGGFEEGIVNELIATLGVGSGPVSWELQVGQSAEAAYRASARESGTWSLGGLNYHNRPRARGVAGVLKLIGGTKRWFIERVTVATRTAGRRRVR